MEPFSVVILCGGEGKRLKHRTDIKCLLPIKKDGTTILDHIVDTLKNTDYESMYLLAGPHKETIEKHIKMKKYRNVHVVEDSSTGTTEALREAIRYMQVVGEGAYDLLLVNGDEVLDMTPEDMVMFTKQIDSITTTMITSQSRFHHGIVVGGSFIEKPQLQFDSNAGYVYIHNNRLSTIVGNGNIETDFFPYLYIVPYRFSGFWRAVDTEKDYQEVLKWFNANSSIDVKGKKG